MKRITRTVLHLLCTLTGHASSCWLLNHGLSRLWTWGHPAAWQQKNPHYTMSTTGATSTTGAVGPEGTTVLRFDVGGDG